jgi:hypothetical protein
MAHIEDRWYRVQDGDRVPTPLCGRGLRYRVRYTDPDGRERSKSFPDRDKRAAEAFLVTVEADKLRGSYIDPQAGRISLRRYASEWLAAQTFDESTREATESRLRVHIYPLPRRPAARRHSPVPCAGMGPRASAAEGRANLPAGPIRQPLRHLRGGRG